MPIPVCFIPQKKRHDINLTFNNIHYLCSGIRHTSHFTRRNHLHPIDMEKQVQMQYSYNQMYEYAASLLVDSNKTPEETKKIIIEKGLDEESASMMVANLVQQITEAKRKQANKDMLVGGLWCVGGLVVTIATMAAASGGGTYVVAWGAIIFGAIQFIRGAANASR